MKIYINKPKDNWLSPYTIIEKAMFWREIEYKEPIVQFWKKILDPFCDGLYAVRKFINRDIRYVKVDYWDSWSVDTTLSPIIAPLIKQLKKHKHGAPFVEDDDVPPKLRSKKATDYKTTAKHQDIHSLGSDSDDNFFKRWDYVLDEMIWTFETLSQEDHESKFYDHSKSKKIKDLNKSVRALKVNRKGLEAHWNRINNGLRLFGKYYMALWD